MSWALSCLSLREHYDEVELYTDSAGYHILIEVLQLPYTKTHVIFDDFQCLPQHWALSKIKTYSLQTEPFLHIDGDIYLPRPLPKRNLNAPLVAQNREIGTIYYRHMMDHVLRMENLELPDYVMRGLKENSIASYNMGVFGGTDITFIHKYCEEVLRFIDTNRINRIAGCQLYKVGIFKFYLIGFHVIILLLPLSDDAELRIVQDEHDDIEIVFL
jgi:hypothetical protein